MQINHDFFSSAVAGLLMTFSMNMSVRYDPWSFALHVVGQAAFGLTAALGVIAAATIDDPATRVATWIVIVSGATFVAWDQFMRRRIEHRRQYEAANKDSLLDQIATLQEKVEQNTVNRVADRREISELKTELAACETDLQDERRAHAALLKQLNSVTHELYVFRLERIKETDQLEARIAQLEAQRNGNEAASEKESES